MLKKSQQSLKNWSDQDWGTKSGKKSSETGERYLPKKAREALSDSEYASTTAAKRKDKAAGKQHSKQPKKIAEKTAKFRMAKGGKAKKKDSRLTRAGVSGYNQPKRTPNHPTKSHIVVAKSGDKIKTIRFGQQGAKTAGKPKAGESRKTKMKRKSFKARHAKNIAKGVLSAAYWANKVKW